MWFARSTNWDIAPDARRSVEPHWLDVQTLCEYWTPSWQVDAMPMLPTIRTFCAVVGSNATSVSNVLLRNVKFSILESQFATIIA